MQIADLFTKERVRVGLAVANRHELFGYFAKRADALRLIEQNRCLQALSDREALGSTALGRGVAMPHARIEGMEHPVGICVTLEKAIDLEAADQEPVDVVFMLLMPAQPASEQLKVLSSVARIARQEPVINALRQAGSSDEALAILEDAEA